MRSAKLKPMQPRLNILAVDDEPSVASSLKFVLAGAERQLTTAGDGDEALERVAANHPPFDVVITDNNMPRMSGLELVRRLREENFAGKIVVLSAHLSDENRRAYEALHVDEMIPKPFDIGHLRETIDRLSQAA
jgi:two-component system, chemotaxis family, chemotaxis protein CheY